MFKTTTKTIEDWKQVFTNYLHDAQAQSETTQGSTKFLFPDPDKFALKTP